MSARRMNGRRVVRKFNWRLVDVEEPVESETCCSELMCRAHFARQFQLPLSVLTNMHLEFLTT